MITSQCAGFRTGAPEDVTADEAWDVLQGAGFHNQFEGGWRVINPGPRLVGQVVTAVFMPRRPDVDSVIQANGKKRIASAMKFWIIDILKPGDVWWSTCSERSVTAPSSEQSGDRNLFEEP